jgi:hypothetical protein
MRGNLNNEINERMNYQHICVRLRATTKMHKNLAYNDNDNKFRFVLKSDRREEMVRL